MNLIRDVLDKQVVDRTGSQFGKADGLIIVLREGAPPQVAFIEIGTVTLARRLAPSLSRWTALFWEKTWGTGGGEPFRVSWQKVRDVGIDIEFDIDRSETSFHQWQDWLRRRIVGRMPGGGHE